MKLMRSAVLMLALVATAGACDSDDDDDDINGGGVTVADFAGTWTVQSFTYTADTGSPSTNLSAFTAAQGGPFGITTMTVQNNGSFSGTLRLPDGSGGVAVIPIGGTLDLGTGNNITVDFNAATEATGRLEDEAGTFSFSGANDSQLTLTLPDVSFDHTLAGNTEVASDLVIVASRS